MNRKALEKHIHIATPVVWAGAEIINPYTERLSRLISLLNEACQQTGPPIVVKKAIVDVYSVAEAGMLDSYENIDLKSYSMSEQQREDKGMAHWWYASVRRAFDLSPSVNSVLYYPIDVCWEDSEDNTVAHPGTLCQMLRVLSHNDQEERLVIGNYVSSNHNKEHIEAEVRRLLLSRFPHHDPTISRVRSEFWGITRALFDQFEAACSARHGYPKVADPSLLLILFCLGAGKQIIGYDLGRYKVEGQWGQDKMDRQIERARQLINDFADGRFCQG